MKKRNLICLAAGLLLACFFELCFAGFGASHGAHIPAGAGEEFPLTIQSSQFYEIDGDYWHAVSSAPSIFFGSEEAPGQIRVRLKEPINKDVPVYLHYTEAEGDLFLASMYRNTWSAAGTREIRINVRRGDFHNFHLRFLSDYMLDGLYGVPSYGVTELTLSMLAANVSMLRLLLLVIFCCAGIVLKFVEKNSGQKKRPAASKASSALASSVTSSGKPRVIAVDLIRVLAFLMVVSIHVLEPDKEKFPVFSMQYTMIETVTVWLWNCNLLFVMISGALLLPWKEESLGAFVRKRFLRVLIPIFVYSVFYIWGSCSSFLPFTDMLYCYIRSILSGSILSAPHFWLIYLILGLYLAAIPFRYALHYIPEKEQKILFCMILALDLAEGILSLIGIELGLLDTFFTGFTGVFLLGYFMMQPWMRKYDMLIIAGGVFCAAIVPVVVRLQPDAAVILVSSFWLLAPMSCAIFAAAIKLGQMPEFMARPLKQIGDRSYSALLIHYFVIYQICVNGIFPVASKLKWDIITIVACTIISLGLAWVTDLLVTDVIAKAVDKVLPDSRKKTLTDGQTEL
ncbi:MAG: acyltransferase [Eubacteriales bacterium]|nr:acyltransferase [Eubacteriales bacterium]